MRILTTTTTTTALQRVAGPDASPADDQPCYAYAGNGTFLPANAAAHEECRRWNDYADVWNARVARRSARQ